MSPSLANSREPANIPALPVRFKLLFKVKFLGIKSSKFFRIYNEIPTILLIVVIFAVVFKPL